MNECYPYFIDTNSRLVRVLNEMSGESNFMMKGSPKSRSAISVVIIAFLTMDLVVIAMSIGSAIVRPENYRRTRCIRKAVKKKS